MISRPAHAGPIASRGLKIMFDLNDRTDIHDIVFELQLSLPCTSSSKIEKRSKIGHARYRDDEANAGVAAIECCMESGKHVMLFLIYICRGVQMCE